MLKKYIPLFIMIFSAIGFAQELDMLYVNNGKVRAILLTVPPEFDEHVVISRKAAGSNEEFTALNASTPLAQSDDPALFESLLGSDMESLIHFFDAEDESDALRRTIGSSIEASIASLLYPGAARISGRMFIDSTAATGKSYEYKVEYLNIYNKKVKGFNKSVTAVVVQPETPSTPTSKISGIVHTLQWEYPKWAEDMSNLAVRFNVYRKVGKGSFQKINENIIIRNDAEPGSFSELVTDSIPEAEYQITAVDLLGTESKPSKSIKVKLMTDEIPVTPSEVNAIVGSNSISVVWNFTTDPMVTGYNVYRREGSHGDTIKISKKPVGKETPFFTDTLAHAKITYYYMIRAISKNGKESKLSGLAVGEIVDNTPPVPPTGLKATSMGNYIKLDWKASSSKDVAHYNIYRGESSSLLISVATTTSTTFIDSGYGKNLFTPGQYYFYAISATDEVELQGEKGDTVSIRYIDKDPPPPPSPLEVKVLPKYHFQIRAGMNPVKDLANVNIYRKNISGKKEELIAVKKTLPVIYVDTTAIKNQSYIYMVESIDSSGNKSGRSISDTVKLVDLYKPAAVPEVTSIFKKGAGVNLSWIAVVEEDLAGYYVYRSLLPTGIYEKLNSSPVKENKFTDKTGNAKYFYKVSAVDQSGNESSLSNYSPVIELEEK